MPAGYTPASIPPFSEQDFSFVHQDDCNANGWIQVMDPITLRTFRPTTVIIHETL
jgi:hypothetical protein